MEGKITWGFLLCLLNGLIILLLGDFIKEKDRCKKCKGKRVTEEDMKLEVRAVNYCTFTLRRPVDENSIVEFFTWMCGTRVM